MKSDLTYGTVLALVVVLIVFLGCMYLTFHFLQTRHPSGPDQSFQPRIEQPCPDHPKNGQICGNLIVTGNTIKHGTNPQIEVKSWRPVDFQSQLIDVRDCSRIGLQLISSDEDLTHVKLICEPYFGAPYVLLEVPIALSKIKGTE